MIVKILLVVGLSPFGFGDDSEVRVGAKAFTEGYILGELVGQTLEVQGHVVERYLGMGGTGIVFEALSNREIDVYVEYTGTISEAILKNPNLRDFQDLRRALDEQGLVISNPLGFSNNYALAVRKDVSERFNLKTISDLVRINSEGLRGVFSHEFVTRKDGLEGLRRFYNHPLVRDVTSMEHALAYEAIKAQKADVMEVYSTDARIESLNLTVLQDDRSYFPDYQAVILARQEFVNESPRAWAVLTELEESLSERQVRRLNAKVDIDKISYVKVVRDYLKGEGVGAEPIHSGGRKWKSFWQRTKEHLGMVFVTMLMATLVGMPLAVLANRKAWLGQGILMVASLFQTIPSLALLCFLIPLFGVGLTPALVALFLYSLLPVVVNTVSGFRAIDGRLLEVADTLDMTSWQRLLRVELPLASPAILSGIRTATIITIATATLAALIGAGGYGVPIVRGLAINSMTTILWGAIPAALMALVVHGVFEVLERLLVPKPLRTK